jgi:hypothetical protein
MFHLTALHFANKVSVHIKDRYIGELAYLFQCLYDLMHMVLSHPRNSMAGPNKCHLKIDMLSASSTLNLRFSSQWRCLRRTELPSKD